MGDLIEECEEVLGPEEIWKWEEGWKDFRVLCGAELPGWVGR